jgi:hypothetical protein
MLIFILGKVGDKPHGCRQAVAKWGACGDPGVFQKCHLIGTLLIEYSRLQLYQPCVVVVPSHRLRLVRHRKQVGRGLIVVDPQLVDDKVAAAMVRDAVLIGGGDDRDGRVPDVVGDRSCQVVEGPVGGIWVGQATL